MKPALAIVPNKLMLMFTISLISLTLPLNIVTKFGTDRKMEENVECRIQNEETIKF